MGETPLAYLPRDRLESLSQGYVLPDKSSGSILFADISGFTPMTEVFEKYLGARKGGEELARILNQVYDELIHEVDRFGGSVIGFAGDAITCWYKDDDGARAVNSALAMQQKMVTFQSIASPGGGSLAIGLKAAITTGAVRRFEVGNEKIQKTDAVAGEPVYRVAELEHLAEKGMVVIDNQTKRSLSDRVTYDGARRNTSTGLIAYVVKSIGQMDKEVAWPPLMESKIPREIANNWIISQVRNRLNSGLSEFITELRPATAIFVKFSGIDFEHDPSAGEKLDEFYSGVQALVANYEGIVLQLTIGDKGSYLYAAFGAPISHEDDTIRAMTVALEINKFACSLDFIESIQTGIGRGTTRTGTYGGKTRRTYGVLGDQVNLAARLMAKAKPGQILVSNKVKKNAGDVFQLREMDPILVKGKVHPEIVHELIDIHHHHPKLALNYSMPLIGRQTEEDHILSTLKEVTSQRGCVLSVSADAGLGKTRLLHECVKRLEEDGFRIFLGECQTFGANSAYTPWWSVWRDFFGIDQELPAATTQQLLEDRLNSIKDSLGPRAPLLAPVLNLPLVDNELTRSLEPKIRRSSMEGLLIDCLRDESNRNPVLIMLDDSHAMDEVSVQLLRAITQAIARMPVAILVAGRFEQTNQIFSESEKSLEYFHSFQLGELTHKGCVEFIESKIRQSRGQDSAVPNALVDRILSRTGGNPFFIDEVLNWVIEQDIDIRSERELNRLELPGSLHSLVLSRMDQLEENPRITMKVASVIGREFRAAMLWGVYPQLGEKEDVLRTLDTLSRCDITELSQAEPELLYLFKHVLVQEVAYESLTSRLREQIHEAIGNHIEKTFEQESMQILDLLAFHYGRSTNQEKKKVYFLKAGNHAKAAYNCESARRYFELVLPMCEAMERATVLRELGHMLEIVGEWDTAMRSYNKALLQAEKLHEQSFCAYCQLDIGDLLRKTGSFDEAGTWFDKAEKNFEMLADLEGVGQVLHSAGTLAAQTGAYKLAEANYRKSLDIRKQLGNEPKVASLLSNLGIIERFQGNVDRALELQNESLEIRGRLKDPFFLGISFNNLGMVKRDLGDLNGARQDLEEALKIFRQIGDRAELSNVLNSLAEVALVQKDADACEQYLLESLQLVRELGNIRGLAFLFEAFAFNALNQDNPGRCVRLFTVAERLRNDIGAPLPEKEQKKIEETLSSITSSNLLDAVDKEKQIGKSLSISEALDYAAEVGSS